MMNAMEMFGLTEEQLHILYSLEYQITKMDILGDKKINTDKTMWLKNWETALNPTQEDKITIPYKKYEELVLAVEKETKNSPNKTWFYLVMLEASLFIPYSPLGENEDKRYKKLRYTSQAEALKRFAFETKIMDPVYVDRFQKIYTKSLNKITGKWQKITIGAMSVLLTAAITAATAGAFAGPIAVALVGESFAGLSGAALTSTCLAMIGGGAIAVGGHGMVGGVLAIVGGGAILGAAGGGAAVSVGAILINDSPEFTLTQAAKLEVVLKEITLNIQKDVVNAQLIIKTLKDRIMTLQREILELKVQEEKNKKKIATLNKSFDYLQRAYKEMAVFCSAFETGMQVEE